MWRSTCILILFSSLLLFPSLRAQPTPYTEKLFLNIGLNANRLHFEEDNFDDSDAGGGLALRLGYGFTPTFALYLGVSGARMDGKDNNVINDDYALGIGELGARFHFGKKLKSPTFYADVSLQGVAVNYQEGIEVEFSGGGLGLGAGLLVFVGNKLALDFGIRGSGGRYSEVRLNNVTVNIEEDDIRYGITRLGIGISWFPMR